MTSCPNPEAPAASSRDAMPGDVLLMLGEGPLSALIAWCGDSIYSHAALVADDGDLIEAAAHGVRRYPLMQRLNDHDNYPFVDLFRPHEADGRPLPDGDRAAVLAHAVSLLGVPYPLDRLATLGVLVAVRGKLPSHWLARLIVREALDHLVRNDPSHMVCSEVVYRSFAECDAQPRGRLAPTVVLEPRGTAPFPKIDWKALWDEVWPLLHPKRRQALAAVAAQTGGEAAERVATAADLAPADDELADSLAAARARLGLSASAATPILAATPPLPVPNPNPKLVTPLDLASSPSLMRIGRLSGAASPVPADAVG